MLRLEQIQRLLSSFEAQDGLRFPNRRRELVDALVLPWIETAPSSDIQRCLLEFLLRHLKHPRVHPGRWHDVSEAALGVVRKWLAQETLEEFFEIVDKSALDAHWRYRRAFWLAYFKRGALDDAWMALGPRASRTARAALGDGLACGHLRSGYGAQPTHSLLLMQIGELIVAEWSHDGKCRVWRRSDARAPKLGQNAYTRTEIVTASLQIVPTYSEDGIVHRSSEQGFWQGQLSQFIYRQTNIRVARREYMPNAR